MKKITKKRLIELEKDVSSIARRAGALLRRLQKDLDTLDVNYKEALGAVSKADIASEEFIIKKLGTILPEVRVLAEEDFYSKFKNNEDKYQTYANDDYLWVIDPLDGTNNYIHGLEHYCVCISLTHKSQPVLGVVYIPEKNELYTAIKGEGAYLVKGSKRIKIHSSKSRKKGLLLATGFATEKGKPFDDEFKKFKKVMTQIAPVRRLGSAAIDLCYVANGIFDGFWEKGLAPWDMAAAKVICNEAGAKITEYNGRKHDIFSKTIIVGRSPLYKRLNETVSD